MPYVPLNSYFTNLFEEVNSINELIDWPEEIGVPGLKYKDKFMNNY